MAMLVVVMGSLFELVSWLSDGAGAEIRGQAPTRDDSGG